MLSVPILLVCAVRRSHTSSLFCWTWFTSFSGILKAGLEPTANIIVAPSSVALPQLRPVMLTSCSYSHTPPQLVKRSSSCILHRLMRLSIVTQMMQLPCTHYNVYKGGRSVKPVRESRLNLVCSSIQSLPDAIKILHKQHTGVSLSQTNDLQHGSI